MKHRFDYNTRNIARYLPVLVAVQPYTTLCTKNKIVARLPATDGTISVISTYFPSHIDSTARRLHLHLMPCTSAREQAQLCRFSRSLSSYIFGKYTRNAYGSNIIVHLIQLFNSFCCKRCVDCFDFNLGECIYNARFCVGNSVTE